MPMPRTELALLVRGWIHRHMHRTLRSANAAHHNTDQGLPCGFRSGTSGQAFFAYIQEHLLYDTRYDTANRQ